MNVPEVPQDREQTRNPVWPDDYDPYVILGDPAAHHVHKVIAAINVRSWLLGEQWSKCANCGDPYPLTESWGNETVCSMSCASAYTDYINSETGRF